MANEADQLEIAGVAEKLNQEDVATAEQEELITLQTVSPEPKKQDIVPAETMGMAGAEMLKATIQSENANAPQVDFLEAKQADEIPTGPLGSDRATIGTNGGEGSTQNAIATEEHIQDKKESEVEIKHATKESTSDRKGEGKPVHVERDWRERREDDNRRDNHNSRGGRGGRGGSFQAHERKLLHNFNDNVKSDLTSLPESSDPEEIRKQVEFYFSDSNLPGDKFLLSKVGGSKNDPVEIAVIHSFKRMRHFQPYSAVVEALRASEILDVVDDDKIRRKIPLPADIVADNARANVELIDDKTRSRSIYAKGFGLENASTQFDIEAFFAPYGPTNAIRLRRKDNKLFKGSVFVEFDCDETARAFLELESKPKWEGKDLQIMSKEKYVRGKAEDVAAGRIKPNTWSPRGGRGRGRGNRDRDNRDGRDNNSRNGHRPNRGRGSRGGWRGGDRNRSRDRNRDGRLVSNGDGKGELPKRKVDDRGIPVVEATQAGSSETTSEAPTVISSTDQMHTSPAAPPPVTESKKRNAPTDDAENAPADAKKAKTELDGQAAKL